VPSSPAAVVRLRKVEHRLEQVFVREYLRTVNKVLKSHDVAAITAAISRPDDLSSIVSLWKDRVDKVIIPQMLSVYRDASKNMLARYPEIASLLPKDYLNVLRNVRADAFVAERANRILNVGEDMFRATSEQVQASLEAGEGAEKLADRVRSTLSTGVSRSRTIARTEAGTAVNSADFTVATDAGVKTKTWVATDDDRTRESHTELDGTTVPINEPFPNGLMHPNDPAGDPEEVINCRCTMAFGFEAR
jgi:SPP1 gp7 family putative phage head morphogenesis protein